MTSGRAASISAIATLLLATQSEAALRISKDPTQNVNCTGGTCTATAADAVLNVHDVKTALASGDLTVAAGSDALNIVVADKFQWANSHRLTLDAFHSVIFSKAVTVEGTGGVTVTPNDGGSGGDLVFTDKGKLAFWDLSSSLVVAGRPYTLIGDIAGLNNAVTADPSGHYALAKMFDAQGHVYSKAPVRAPFTGTFSGLGHAIANFHITFDNGGTGLFKSIDAGGVVRDLTLQDVVIAPSSSPKAGRIGTLAGDNAGTVSNVTVLDGSVDARGPRHGAPTGGLVGNNTGTIASSSVLGTAVVSMDAGGLAGVNSGTITRSRANATVHGGNGGTAGGLTSSNSGLIALSSAGGSVVVDPAHHAADGDDISGGLTAVNTGTIDRSFSTASVDGGSGGEGEEHESSAVSGGLVGFGTGNVVNSYARGAVVASASGLSFADVGGFAGALAPDAGSVHASYSTGLVTCNCSNHDGVQFGGYTGDSGTVVTKSYWDTDTSMQTVGCGGGDCSKVKARTTAQLTSALPPGFAAGVWAQDPGINDGYPYLIDNPPQ